MAKDKMSLKPFWRGLITTLLLVLGFVAVILIRDIYNTPADRKDGESSATTASPPSRKTAADKNPQNLNFEDAVFPEEFLFGTASSDFQTQGLSPASDWSVNWEKYSRILEEDFKKKGLDQKPVNSGTANDFYARYQEDLDLAGDNKITQLHRLSLEWARIEPKEGKWDLDAIKKYRDILSYMKKRGIEPMICLNHFPNPNWFTEKGGWENNRAPYYYARYASFVAKNLGVPLKITWWLTFNEPQFTIRIPYGDGSWPPFKGVKNLQDKEGFARIMHVTSNVLDGHRLAYRAIHRELDRNLPHKKVMVSLASAAGAFYPNDENSPLDQLVSNAFNVVYTLSLDSFIGNTDRDFIGLNYYGRFRLKLYMSLWDTALAWLTKERPFAIEWLGPEKLPTGGRPREFYPQGLYDQIMKFKDYGLPIMITENGINDEEDKFREEFIVIHLKAIHDAMRDGANVIGYQYWSLTDTWEPGDASFSNFGLIAIDRKNSLERKLRPSALTYAEIIKSHRVSKELLEKHKELLIQN